jgi:hypothetical protein
MKYLFLLAAIMWGYITLSIFQADAPQAIKSISIICSVFFSVGCIVLFWVEKNRKK